MENEASTVVDSIIQQEMATNEEILDKEEEAKRSLADLYSSIEKLYILRKGTKEGLVGINDFINTIHDKYVGVNIESFEQRKKEIVELLENISWSIRSVIDKINNFERDVKKIGD